jgi:DNA repair protein RecO (recombination protein O)
MTADRLTSEESISAEAQYLLLVGALRTLVSGDHASSLVLDAYLLRSLSMAGYSPTLNACVICGVAGTQPFFHVSTGGALCVEHRVPGSVAPRPESFELMQALMSGDWEAADIFSRQRSQRSFWNSSGVCAMAFRTRTQIIAVS